jgi:tetratricopeptide (TPR) repeat protein
MSSTHRVALAILVMVVVGFRGCAAPDVSDERDKGIGLYHQHRHIEAMATFRHCLKQHPNDPESNYYMGLCYRSIAENKLREDDIAGANRQFDSAIFYFGKAIQQWPNYAAAIEAQNEAMEARGKASRALARAQQIANENRPNEDMYVFLGREYAERGDFDGAVSAYEKAIDRSPGDATAYAELGRVYLRLGDTRTAAMHLQRAYDLNPKEPGVRADLERINIGPDGRVAADRP